MRMLTALALIALLASPAVASDEGAAIGSLSKKSNAGSSCEPIDFDQIEGLKSSMQDQGVRPSCIYLPLHDRVYGLLDQGEPEDAEALLHRAIGQLKLALAEPDLMPRFEVSRRQLLADLVYLLGVVYFVYMDDFPGAEQAYSEVINITAALDPTSPSIPNFQARLVDALVRQGKWDRAAAILQELSVENASGPLFHLEAELARWAAVEFHRARYDQAAAAWRKMIDYQVAHFGSSSAEAWAVMAGLYAAAGDVDSQALAERQSAESPSGPEVRSTTQYGSSFEEILFVLRVFSPR